MSMTYNVTIFKDIKDTSTPFYRSVGVVLGRIRDGASKDLVKKIRAEKRKAERQELKKSLPSICFSGKFSRREDSALVEHSGLICLDFDGYHKSKDMLQDKERMCNSPYVYSVFISPSGSGLKVLVKIPRDPENHKNYFNSLRDHFDSPYFDSTSKNVSRVCYESYDPLIYVNENSSVWSEISEPEYTEVDKSIDQPTIPITDENKIVEILVKWWSKKYPMEVGVRNNNAFVLAMAMNEFGINRSLAEYVLNQYATQDFSLEEIKRTIDSAYSKTDKWATKYYEDQDTINNVKAQLKRGTSRKDVKANLVTSGIRTDIAEAVVSRVEEDSENGVFWTKNDKGKVQIDHIMFKSFLEDNGFYKYCPEGGKNYVFVKVTNNLVDHTSEKEIKDFVLNHLLELDDVTVYNYFADQTRFFREEFLSLLSTIDIYFIGDTKYASYLYYRNCAVQVTKDDIKIMDYMDLGGYVWKDHVINRSFSVTLSIDCDYSRFIENVCNHELERIKSMRSTIGFLLHGYKNLSYCPAVILNDEVISDNPEGGTGKGIFINAISQMKKLVVIDGKSFTFERSFAYQLVSADTQVLCFDDVKKHFDFERLFSVVTEGLTLEKKNKDAIKIPFEKSPKVAITTNYAIRGAGNSFARRKWELEFHQHYRKHFTPLDEFGRLMFGDWDDEEWAMFDNYMISCLQMYMSKGLVESKFVNLKIRQLSAETTHDFIEWCGLIDSNEENSMLAPDRKVYKQDLYDSFISEYPDYGPKSKMTISRTKFYRWLHSYSVYRYGIQPDEGRDVRGRWIIFLSERPNEEVIDI